MPEFGVTQVVARGLAVTRAAEAMLRAAGGGEAVFRLQLASPPDNATLRELGLEPAGTEDVAVTPVLMRQLDPAVELLLSPKSLEPHLQLRGLTAEEFLGTTTAIVTQDRTFRITGYQAEVFAEAVYLFRISAME
jgi:hypothetical protein